MPRALLGCLFLAALGTSAIAEPTSTSTSTTTSTPTGPLDQSFTPRRLMVVNGPAMPLLKPASLGGHTIFLDRCIGGCSMTPGDDNMVGSPIASGIVQNPLTIAEATDITEAEWQGAVQCVKEVYSPFDVKIVDTLPVGVAVYSGIIVGGNNSDKAGAKLGLPPDVGGIVTGTGCGPNPRGVAYAFADNGNVNAFAFEAGGDNSTQSRINGLCWIIAQETAHSFGLPNHEYQFSDDKASACNDPMTYRFECGGQKFFRNRFADCGEFNDGTNPRPCSCGVNQNSHLKLLNVFGEGTSLIPAPTASITMPAGPSTAANSLGSQVLGLAGSKRGVGRVEMYLNGYKWAEVTGAAFQRNIGQPNPSQYSIQVPAGVPDSIVDLQLKAFDDLELVGESQIVTVTKGAAGGCVSADACAVGQKCEQGKCFWDPPVGEIGDDCTFPQFCKSGECSNSTVKGAGICTRTCVPGVEGACDVGLECLQVGNSGICYLPQDGGGCCSSSSGGTPWAPFVLGGSLLGFLVLRRRQR